MTNFFETKYLFLLLNLFLGYIITLIIIIPVINMIKEAKFVRPNFRGELIPVGVGIVFFITSLIVFIPCLIISPIEIKHKSVQLLAAIAGITCLGLIDDNWGSRDATGLKGHFKQLFKGRITTGAIKALGGGLIAFIISIFQGQGIQILLNTLIIALSINSINLLDLRPGRAGKGFILGALFLTIFGWERIELNFLFIFLGALIAYLPFDLKANVMMGDSGSNALGIILGIISVWILPLTVKIVLLVFLVTFHILTEKYSLTKIIEKNKLLDSLDRLGRQ
ncbi:hypothetical protein [Desulfolucanica intricata]|uniref:hypothetical protein n=1 Tax=Desulfolucanica intricata TaxID=1285191 RepID=UPI0008362A35|nr:hypothetical protein [Desulfolucanica intricata]